MSYRTQLRGLSEVYALSADQIFFSIFLYHIEHCLESHIPICLFIYSYPASFEECVSVAAIGKEKDLPVAKFSNSNVQVDYSGIGVDVISFKPYGGYQKMSGTSMACPHVCGFIAAISNPNDAKDTSAIRTKLTNEYSMDIGAPGPDTSTGLGFVTYLSEDELAQYFAKMGIQMKKTTASAY